MLRRLKESVASELPQKVEHLLPGVPIKQGSSTYQHMSRQQICPTEAQA
jgi:hypothetical protein